MPPDDAPRARGGVVVDSDTPVRRVAAAMCSADLRHVRRTLERELLAEIAASTTGRMSIAQLGKLELMEAAGSELFRRGALDEPPP